MMVRDAVGWLQAADKACTFFVSFHYRGIVRVALDALEWGTPASKMALARAYKLQARVHLRRVARNPHMFGLIDARVLDFCAAVLRATVEESGEGAALVTESDELRFLREELATARASVRVLEKTAFLREQERDEVRQIAEGRRRDLHEASRQVEDHARREVAAESRAKAAETRAELARENADRQGQVAAEAIGLAKRAEAEVERLRATMLVVKILVKDWDELAERLIGVDWNYRDGLRYCAKKLRNALSEGGRL